MPNLIYLLEHYGVLIVFGIVLVEQLGLPIPAFPILVVAGALAWMFGLWMFWLSSSGLSVLTTLTTSPSPATASPLVNRCRSRRGVVPRVRNRRFQP